MTKLEFKKLGSQPLGHIFTVNVKLMDKIWKLEAGGVTSSTALSISLVSKHRQNNLKGVGVMRSEPLQVTAHHF